MISKILVFTILSCFNATANNTTDKVAVKYKSILIYYKAKCSIVHNDLCFYYNLNKHFRDKDNSRIKTENKSVDSLFNNYKLNQPIK